MNLLSLSLEKLERMFILSRIFGVIMAIGLK